MGLFPQAFQIVQDHTGAGNDGLWHARQLGHVKAVRMGGGPGGETVQELNLLPRRGHIHLHTAQAAVGLGQLAEFMIMRGKQRAGPPPIVQVFQG